jgi:hypothetical protein
LHDTRADGFIGRRQLKEKIFLAARLRAISMGKNFLSYAFFIYYCLSDFSTISKDWSFWDHKLEKAHFHPDIKIERMSLFPLCPSPVCFNPAQALIGQ